MADTEKTIPELPTSSTLNINTNLIVEGAITEKATLGALSLFIRDQIIPAGLTAPFAGSSAPDGWLLCDGSQVSRTTYSRLWDAIGATYGAGDGSTTFNLPDLRGRVIAGKDNMGGSAANRLTNAVAGFDAATLGAAGGSQSYTPAGTIGGSQSIAHNHNIAHTHGSLHVDGIGILRGFTSSNAATVPSGLSSGGNMLARDTADSGGGLVALIPTIGNLNTTFFTSGVNSPPAGSAGSTAASGAMSTNTNVNGSNFTFTGSAAHRVQPTMVMNMIIKT